VNLSFGEADPPRGRQDPGSTVQKYPRRECSGGPGATPPAPAGMIGAWAVPAFGCAAGAAACERRSDVADHAAGVVPAQRAAGNLAHQRDRLLSRVSPDASLRTYPTARAAVAALTRSA
jgi:hypothetical protein